ncbi:MAG: transcription antitermination factor NusB [Candidatus Dadabacteria bacterium]|jgi:N utilization substance protein B|nr:transcription antitermination factor NusB [Candidatus Dadabacteria bacterium]MCZ6528427.1 transcription antitermination factor NusB [Candidatus Dadabacteria bacterium]MCZ6684503.1 transcription antitermination factor NusB [Candidatus Dadabacteria bacterium]MCZ6791116.1 transcription antitermination factor NusB [Candidatus Dadabacteria bacterium]TDI89561.1 MAG: transcription antitermination factor NusB [Candidatus Dadabacteria bacterium]
MGTRRRARELALQFLYQYDLLKESSSDSEGVEELLSFFWDRNEVSPEDDTKEFCCVLIRGSCSNLTYIDEIIGTYSEHWRLTRMATIDRNILRIAIYELLYLRNIPPPVTINEAVELGKRFGTEESGSFINGILDKIRMAQEKGDLSNDN